MYIFLSKCAQSTYAYLEQRIVSKVGSSVNRSLLTIKISLCAFELCASQHKDLRACSSGESGAACYNEWQANS